MVSSFERMVAWRYLRSKKAEGFVSVITAFAFAGIMLGVATLIIVMSVMNGFRAELFGRILGLNGHMNVYSLQGPLMDYGYLKDKVSNVNGVEMVVPMIEAQALASKDGVSTGLVVRGITWEDFMNRSTLREGVKEGSIERYSGAGVAIGNVLAEKLRLTVGDDFVITSPKVKSTPFGSMPRQRTYNVAVIFDVGMYEYNSSFVFMPLDSAQKFFEYSGSVSGLEVFLNKPDEIDYVRAAVARSIEGMAGVYDWRDTNQSFFNALQVERNVMFLILTLIIVVAAFNIISSMIMLVKDKGQDIAILRTVGASRSSMMRIFMLTGASIGVAGTVVGSILGIAFALNIETIRQWLEGLTGTELFADEIYFLSQLPAQVEWHEVAAVVFMALFLSVLATFYPAWRASRLDPVEALRYE
ncbi:MAG: lipoprotein-releasing system transmembrane subunit LolC [Micavibrio sp.]|nr:lipoprotein-releasing system transmembrane subunit LolC [Micavibrio sp.]|tara:strand:+ start:575 stop:1816 length:1242 start_codon:yes stop_codon:yes gene_type:complete